MHPAELIHLSDEQLASADTDGDGKVDIADATRLQKYLAEFEGIVLGKQQNVYSSACTKGQIHLPKTTAL